MRRAQTQGAERTVDANQVVGANFRLARELRGWTQDETAQRLAPFLGQVMPKASISAIERGLHRDRRRVFNAQELVAFALAFDLPMWWFFLPVPGTEGMRLHGTETRAAGLLALVLGRRDQLELLPSRLAAFRITWDKGDVAQLLENLLGVESWSAIEAARDRAVEELAQRQASSIERLVDEMRAIVASFDAVAGRGWLEPAHGSHEKAPPSASQ